MLYSRLLYYVGSLHKKTHTYIKSVIFALILGFLHAIFLYTNLFRLTSPLRNNLFLSRKRVVSQWKQLVSSLDTMSDHLSAGFERPENRGVLGQNR